MLLRKRPRRDLSNDGQKGRVPSVSSPARSVGMRKRSRSEQRTGHICGSTAMQYLSSSVHRHSSARSSGEAAPPETANEVNVPLLYFAQIVLQPETMLMQCEHKLP